MFVSLEEASLLRGCQFERFLELHVDCLDLCLITCWSRPV